MYGQTFENGFTGWANSTELDPSNAGTISKTTVGTTFVDGSNSARLNATVTNANFAILRNEIVNSYVRDNTAIGNSYIYEFSEYVPSGTFATSPLFIETAQLLPNNQHLGEHAGWGPVWKIGVENNHWIMTFTRDVNGNKVDEEVDFGTVTRNQWYNFKIEVKWTPNNDGYIRFYMNSATPVYERNNVSTIYNSTQIPFNPTEYPYFKWGLYTRRAWTLGGNPSPLHSFQIFLDGFSFQEDPGGGSSGPEIAVNFSGTNLADGDSSPSTAEGTDFGDVAVGTTLDRTFNIQNTGTASLTVGTVTTGGAFSVVTQPASTVAAGSSTTFKIRLAPTTVGAKTNTVSFTNNDDNESPFNFSVAGMGVSGGGAAEIAVNYNGTNLADGDSSPSTAEGTDFGNVSVGSWVDRTFTIQNTGGTPLTVGTVTAGGAFSIVNQPASSVTAGSSTTFTIRLTPTTTGAKHNTVSFTNGDNDENPFNFSVTGMGI